MEFSTLKSEFVCNADVRYVEINGRQFAIAPITFLRPRVLVGSKGALYYPEEEIDNSLSAWNGRPLVQRHPIRNGSNVSANAPDIFANQEIGRMYNVKKKGNDAICDGYFDVELTKRIASDIWNKLQRKEPIEISTGLYTDNEEAPVNSHYEGTKYTHVARNYKPDHLAILPDEIGACSVKDGCGVFNKDGAVVTQSSIGGRVNNEKKCPKCIKANSFYIDCRECQKLCCPANKDTQDIAGTELGQLGPRDPNDPIVTPSGDTSPLGGSIPGSGGTNPGGGTGGTGDFLHPSPSDDETDIGDNSSTLFQDNYSMNERANIISWLTTNCACLKDKKATLNALPDNQLKEVLLENAEKTAEVDNDQTFLDWIGNADKEIKNAFTTYMRNKLKGAIKTNDFPAKKPTDPAATGTDTMTEEEKKKKLEEEAAAKAAAAQQNTANNTAQVQPMTQEQLFAQFPALKNLVANAQQQENREKEQLIIQLTANIGDGNQRLNKAKELAVKSIEDLRLFASLTGFGSYGSLNGPVQQQQVANYFGATGGTVDTVTDNAALQQEQLVVNEINWVEWAKNTSVYDNAKA